MSYGVFKFRARLNKGVNPRLFSHLLELTCPQLNIIDGNHRLAVFCHDLNQLGLHGCLISGWDKKTGEAMTKAQFRILSGGVNAMHHQMDTKIGMFFFSLIYTLRYS